MVEVSYFSEAELCGKLCSNISPPPLILSISRIDKLKKSLDNLKYFFYNMA